MRYCQPCPTCGAWVSADDWGMWDYEHRQHAERSHPDKLERPSILDALQTSTKRKERPAKAKANRPRTY